MRRLLAHGIDGLSAIANERAFGTFLNQQVLQHDTVDFHVFRGQQSQASESFTGCQILKSVFRSGCLGEG